MRLAGVEQRLAVQRSDIHAARVRQSRASGGAVSRPHRRFGHAFNRHRVRRPHPQLEEQKIVLSEKVANCGRPLRGFDETLRTSLDFLASPWNLWASERLEDKRAVLKLTFADRLAYVRNEDFRTPNLSLPFKVLADLSADKSKMARPERFELPTPWFVAKYSIQMSYGRW